MLHRAENHPSSSKRSHPALAQTTTYVICLLLAASFLTASCADDGDEPPVETDDGSSMETDDGSSIETDDGSSIETEEVRLGDEVLNVPYGTPLEDVACVEGELPCCPELFDGSVGFDPGLVVPPYGVVSEDDEFEWPDEWPVSWEVVEARTTASENDGSYLHAIELRGVEVPNITITVEVPTANLDLPEPGESVRLERQSYRPDRLFDADNTLVLATLSNLMSTPMSPATELEGIRLKEAPEPYCRYVRGEAGIVPPQQRMIEVSAVMAELPDGTASELRHNEWVEFQMDGHRYGLVAYGVIDGCCVTSTLTWIRYLNFQLVRLGQ